MNKNEVEVEVQVEIQVEDEVELLLVLDLVLVLVLVLDLVLVLVLDVTFLPSPSVDEPHGLAADATRKDVTNHECPLDPRLCFASRVRALV